MVCVVRDVTRCTVSLLMIIFCITYRYIAVRVLQSTVDTSEEIWYQFILEACARKYQPNKELREKHGVLEISLLAEKVCTIWAWKCHFFLTGTALGYPPRAAVYRKNSVERGSPRVSTKFVSIYIYTIFIMRVHSNGTSMRVCTHAGKYINSSKLGSGCVLYTWAWFSIAILRHANKSGIAKLFL